MKSKQASGRQQVRDTFLVLALLVLMGGAAGGCASSDWVEVRSTPRNPLEGPLNLLSRKGPRPTERTVQLLRRYDLEENLRLDSAEQLEKLQEVLMAEPTADKLHAYAELAYIAGKKRETLGDDEQALDLYGASVAHAYLYLLDDRFAATRNPYDPHFRTSCDLYNGALESALRIVSRRGELKPGSRLSVHTAQQQFDVDVQVRGRWRPEEFERFEFVSDYEVQGLTNHYQTFGLGVPLIAVRKTQPTHEPAERFYPPQLSFPVTAFLRVTHDQRGGVGKRLPVQRCVLELYDPLQATDILVEDRRVPLESDLSTPLAYFLNDKSFRKVSIATFGLLNPNAAQAIRGLYMLDAYDPAKIPVVMVHGLWSSPLTWTQMFNDLRAAPELSRYYQFWFYLYPTGQPFWLSANNMRQDLGRVREVLDPQHNTVALDQMVLVGHSMGGLVSKMQTLESREDFWHLVSDRSPQDLKGEPDDREQLLETLFFHPNPSVKRVITIGTPHRGSDFANHTTQWLSHKLIRLPMPLLDTKHRLVRENPGLFRHPEVLAIDTSIDSLAPDSPFFPVMLQAPKAPWVKYHNIVGEVKKEWWLARVAKGSDGVVSVTSAHLDDVESEIVVPADHVTVHQHPRAVLEVRRVLLAHLDDLRRQEAERVARQRFAPPSPGLPPGQYGPPLPPR